MITGKNIVLTGATSGIGFEVLRLLSNGEGNRILAVGRNISTLSSFPPEKVIPMSIDVSSAKAVDLIFEKAISEFGSIDIFYANAGYPYYEEMDYADWDRIAAMFETNVFSPIYSYQKFVKHLNGRKGIFALTVSAIGQMAMPGFTLYSSSKFAMHGFQQGVRLEKPENVQLTCLYPVATNTNFFKAANSIEFKKPFPVQEPATVARKMVSGIEKGKKSVSPCLLFGISKALMTVCPPVRTAYWMLEKRKFEDFKRKKAELSYKEAL